MNRKEVEQLKKALSDTFNAQVNARPIPSRRGRYEFSVISPKFKRMKHLARQDRIWNVVDKAIEDRKLSRDSMIDISLILAYAPDEIEQPA